MSSIDPSEVLHGGFPESLFGSPKVMFPTERPEVVGFVSSSEGARLNVIDLELMTAPANPSRPRITVSAGCIRLEDLRSTNRGFRDASRFRCGSGSSERIGFFQVAFQDVAEHFPEWASRKNVREQLPRSLNIRHRFVR